MDLLARLPRPDIMLPVRVLGDLFLVLVRKARRTPEQARAAILNWRNFLALVETSAEIMMAAADLAVTHQSSIWNAVVICAADESDCRLLLSADIQDGFIWRGVTVVNPFATRRNPLLAALLAESFSSPSFSAPHAPP